MDMWWNEIGLLIQFLFLLGSRSWELFYLYSHDKFMVHSTCCKSIFLGSCWYYYQDLFFMPEMMLLCRFLSDLVFIATSTSPYLFSFDEPKSISDLGLNCDLRAIEYGGNIKILPSWIYEFGRIEGIIWKFDVCG